MRGGRCRGKLSEVAVVGGVGVAVLLGWGCAVAAADDNSGGSSSAGSSAHTDAGPKKKGDAGDQSARRGTSRLSARSSTRSDAGLTKRAGAGDESAPADEEPQPEETASEETTDVVKVDSGRRSRAAHAEVSRPARPADFGARHRRT